MSMQFTVRNAISGITVESVCDGHSAGTGTLIADSADSLTWQAPGSELAGDPVKIANGETQVLFDGEDAALKIVVSRTSDADLSGTSYVLILTAKTTAARLAEVDAAITECLRAQQAGQGDSNVRMAELAALRAYRNELEAKLLREQGTNANVAFADMRGNF